MAFGLSLGFMGLGSRGAGGPAYDLASSAYFAAMSVEPDDTRKGHLDALITGLKDDGIWTKLDWLMICAAHDEQAGRINAVNPAQEASVPAAPTFTTDRGFTGNGTTDYLNSGWNPTTASSPKYVQNSAHMGVWVGTNVFANQADVGAARAFLNSRAFSGMSVYPNSTGQATTALPSATSIGHSLWTRRGSTEVEKYKDGASIATPAITSSALLNANFFIGAYSNAGTPTWLSTRRIQAVHWGSQLSDAEALAIYNRLATYMTAVGA